MTLAKKLFRSFALHAMVMTDSKGNAVRCGSCLESIELKFGILIRPVDAVTLWQVDRTLSIPRGNIEYNME